jgi:phage baseplate assembly protein W
MDIPFLGSGISFPLSIEKGSRDLGMSEAEENIRQSIWIILSTAKGERIMRADFGCGVYELLFESISQTTAGRITEAVRESLLRWEPRIDVQDVHVSFESDSEGQKVNLNINYQVRATNNAFNLVYPFYLDRTIN